MKKILITFIAAISVFSAVADNIDYSSASRIASRFVDIAGQGRKTATVANGEVAPSPYYIFNDKSRGKGFVIVSGDDSVGPVLGYSDRGYIDKENVPAPLQSWLDAVASGEVKPMAKADAPATPVVAPLVKTKWYQLAPYNSQLRVPTYFTGCVATAMAQIIKYHEWPKNGHGDGSYYSFYGGDDAEGLVPYDLNLSEYDFDNMLDTYVDGNWNEMEAFAVALLMRDCGHATHMQYTSSESSSFDQDCATAMSENFGYEAEVVAHFGTNRDTQEWIARMKAEFDNKFPVIVNGQATPFGGGGHCFIADGYDSNGFIHINWGWNGDADGYYNICALTPEHSGKLHTFSYLQNFIILHPRYSSYPNFEAVSYNPDLWMLWDVKNKNFEHSGLTVENAGEVLTAENPANIRLDGLFFNALRPYKGKFMLVLVDGKGATVKILSSTPIEREEVQNDEQGQDFSLKNAQIEAAAFDGVPDGTYTIVPVSECEGMKAKPVQVYGYKDHLIATVKDGATTLANVPGTVSALRYVKAFEMPAEVTLFTNVSTEVTIANDADNIDGGSIAAYISPVDDESTSVLLTRVPVAVYEHSQLTVPFSFDILPRYTGYKKFSLENGKKYKVKLVFENYLNEVKEIKDASAPAEFTVKLDPSLVPWLEITSVKVSDKQGNELDTKNLELNIENEYTVEYAYKPAGAGVFPQKIDQITFVLDDKNSQRVMNCSTTSTSVFDIDFMFLDVTPGPSSLKFMYSDFLTGEMVHARPSELSDIAVTLGDSSGVGNIAVDTDPQEVARYNSTGVRVSAPVKGINIVVYSDGTVKKEIR